MWDVLDCRLSVREPSPDKGVEVDPVDRGARWVGDLPKLMAGIQWEAGIRVPAHRMAVLVRECLVSGVTRDTSRVATSSLATSKVINKVSCDIAIASTYCKRLLFCGVRISVG